MEVRELVSVLRRRLWMLLLMPVLAGVVAAAVSVYVLSPIYEASTTLWVVKTDGAALDYNTLIFFRNLTKTYGEIAESRTVAGQVLERLGISGSPAGLQSRVTVTPLRDTEIIAIKVQDPNPELAAAIANTLATVFSEEIRKFIQLDNVRVVDQALVPTTPVRPRPERNIAIALALGLMAAVGLSFLLEYMDVRIRTPDDVERHLGLHVLSVIPVLEPTPDDEQPARRRGASAPARSMAGGER